MKRGVATRRPEDSFWMRTSTREVEAWGRRRARVRTERGSEAGKRQTAAHVWGRPSLAVDQADTRSVCWPVSVTRTRSECVVDANASRKSRGSADVLRSVVGVDWPSAESSHAKETCHAGALVVAVISRSIISPK